MKSSVALFEEQANILNPSKTIKSENIKIIKGL